MANDAKTLLNVSPSKQHLLEAKHFALAERHQQLQLNYLIFTIGLTLIYICIELFIARNSRIIKRKNLELQLNNELMIKQNHYLQSTLNALQESSEENNRMLQIITHDLRSPVAAIVGLAGFMIDEHDLSEEDLEMIKLIHTSALDSVKFINEMLDRGSTNTEIKKELVELHSLLDYCVIQLRFKAKEKGQQIILTTVEINLKLNRAQIWRAMTNLISNAIKFSGPKTNIEVGLMLKNDKALIVVKDQGIGIPHEIKDKIFSLNTERRRAGTSGEKSFGMGLSVAKQHIEAHGGVLYFESEARMGTTFFVELPIL